ncbi:MAG: rhomboid family intramembrane serine protease [Nannocystaceae bacterium]|nr:rhomboid family intramembrane serine protease [Nannocystaceae bacterium]
MFEHAMTICAVCLGFALVRALRRSETRGRSYAALVAGLLALDLIAMLQPSRFLGAVAIGFSVVAVAVPWLLESVARWAFARGRLRMAVGLCGVRAALMPGAGLARQQEILRGLALLETHGVDRALSHFRELAGDAEGGESMVIHEQIVSMLFYGQRWDEGIAHYEARFHPRHAALRPALALGLLRAYGESGRLDTAAGLLRALEEGPVGSDPAAVGFVSQARLTFLAYAGAATTVESALTEPRRRALGLSPASSALLRGIALLRAGQTEAARMQLSRVPELAGAADDRIVEASKSAIARGAQGPIELAPELSRYTELVSSRLEAFLEAAPRLRRVGRAAAAPLLALAILAVELVRNALDRGGVGLLDLGAITAELWHGGSRGRVLAAVFVAGQPLAALLDAYAVWIGGRMIERTVGAGRLLLVAIGGAAAGLVLSLVLPGEDAPLGGASLMAIAVATGGLMLLPRARTPGLSAAARRGLLLPLAITLIVQIGGALIGVFALGVSLPGVWIAALVGVIAVGLLPAVGPIARVAAIAGALALAAVPWGIAATAREDAEAFLVARRSEQRSGELQLRLPSTMVATEPVRDPALPLPIGAGFVDTLAARAGDLVLLQSGAADEQPLPLALDPTLRRELDAVPTEVPPAFARRFGAHGGRVESLRAFHLRRNGVDVALVVERPMPQGRALALLSAPPAALSRAANLYAAVLADATAP